MVGSLQRKESDVALMLAVTEPRSNVIDYAVSIVAVRAPETTNIRSTSGIAYLCCFSEKLKSLPRDPCTQQL